MRCPFEIKIHEFPLVEINTRKKHIASEIIEQFESTTNQESGGWLLAKEELYRLPLTSFCFTNLTIAATFNISIGILETAEALRSRSYILDRSCNSVAGLY